MQLLLRTCKASFVRGHHHNVHKSKQPVLFTSTSYTSAGDTTEMPLMEDVVIVLYHYKI